MNLSKNYRDHYPFGIMIAERTFSNSNYRFGFNGKENDDEVKGVSSSIDFGNRIYDSRLGKFLSVDTKSGVFVEYSPYHFSANNPIMNVDQDGDFTINVHEKMTKNTLAKLGYGDVVQNLLSHYASVFADNPSFKIQLMQMNFKQSGINYNRTKNSQNTASATESTRHAMQGDFEDIGNAAAQRRGQTYGWGKIFDAASEGTIESYKANSNGAESFGEGIHALQDSKVHKGVKFENHDLFADLGGNKAELQAYDITQSAIITIELLNGNYTNLKPNSELDCSGMDYKQWGMVKESIQKSGVKNVAMYDYHTGDYQNPDPESCQGGNGETINYKK